MHNQIPFGDFHTEIGQGSGVASSLYEKCIRVCDLADAKFDRNRFLNTMESGLFSNLFPMKHTNDNLNEGIESGDIDKGSLLKRTRHLITGVALSTMMALGACNDQAQAQDSSVVKVAENTAVAPTALEKDGGIDFSANAVSISDQISNVENKIAALEEKGDLSRADKRELYGLKNELVALENQKQESGRIALDAENQKQEINADAIERKTETVNNLAEIKKKIGS